MGLKIYKWIFLIVLNIMFLYNSYAIPQLCTTKLLSIESCLLSCDRCDEVPDFTRVSQNDNLFVENRVHGRHVSRFKYKIKPVGLATPSTVFDLDIDAVIFNERIDRKSSKPIVTPFYYIILFRYTLF